MIIIDKETGQEFEITSVQATHFYNRSGELELLPEHNVHPNYMHLRLIRKLHTFGGVVFEETGERRPVYIEDWFLDGHGYPVYARKNDNSADYYILRHVCEAQE